MVRTSKQKTTIAIYQTKNGALELKTDSKLAALLETIWMTQDQFDVQKAAISKHMKNIFDSGELTRNSVVSILETTASDQKKYKVTHYNLDAALSVGYRVNSKNATQFRQWATKALKQITSILPKLSKM